MQAFSWNAISTHLKNCRGITQCGIIPNHQQMLRRVMQAVDLAIVQHLQSLSGKRRLTANADLKVEWVRRV